MHRLCTATLIVGIGISLSGCLTDSCAGWKAIKPSKNDKLTDGTARQILAHDEYGESLGCRGFTPKGAGFGAKLKGLFN